MKKMLKDFKDFAMKGNVIDLAVGVIIGGAFGKIVTSLVNDIVMPPIGLLLGKVDFTNLFITLSGEKFKTLAAAQEAGAVTLNVGVFLNTLVNFLIVALVIFVVVKQVNRLEKKTQKEEEAKPATTKECPYCLSTIPLKATRCSACTSELG